MTPLTHGPPGNCEAAAAGCFVGSETCAEKSFAVAESGEIIRVLDCPQWHPASLKRVLDEERAEPGCGTPAAGHGGDGPSQGEGVCIRRLFLVYSDAHRLSFEQAGIPAAQIFQCPLWVDQTLWHPEPRPRFCDETLRVIFAGQCELAESVFFLLEAIERCTKTVELTLARCH